MWQRNSKQYLKENPLCDECYKAHRLTPATVVHHIVDHKGDDTLFWDSANNWIGLCKPCHDHTSKHKEKATLAGRYETR
jgi:5-methylcytosine-specific restriction protein A